MYIEFTLPQGPSGITAVQPAIQDLNIVAKKLSAWAQKHNVEYKTKIIKYKVRVTFDSDEYYTLFGLTWILDSKHPSWTNYRLISDLNNKI
jgi:hypothetical protein